MIRFAALLSILQQVINERSRSPEGPQPPLPRPAVAQPAARTAGLAARGHVEGRAAMAPSHPGQLAFTGALLSLPLLRQSVTPINAPAVSTHVALSSASSASNASALIHDNHDAHV